MHLQAKTSDPVEVLDRILDKGIVADATVSITLKGIGLPPGAIVRAWIESISIQPHGRYPTIVEEIDSLFPYWRRDLWSK